MKKRLSIYIPLLVLMLFGTLAYSQGTAAPEIFFKEKIYIADEVMEGDLIEHTYTVYNRGNAVLNIQKVRPG